MAKKKKKTLKKISSQRTIYNLIDTFEYVPENDKTCEAFYRRFEDIFNVECEQWPCKKRYVYYKENWEQPNIIGL